MTYMKNLLNMFIKFVVLVVAIASVQIGNVQALEDCCQINAPFCTPIYCPRRPCCDSSRTNDVIDDMNS